MSDEPKRTRVINETGLGLAGRDDERIRDIRVYHESGSVQVWVEIRSEGIRARHVEDLQYLSPEEAMAFAKAFERCAIQALKEKA